jgi:hypothetical protein
MYHSRIFHVRENVRPRGAEPYESESRLKTDIGDLIRRYVSVNEDYVRPLVSFVLASWIADRLPVAPYLSIPLGPTMGLEFETT